MAGDASAYAALGLEPGADLAAIEQAYRRLIKQHHPDRDGGDSGRAAELNRAYRELRAAKTYKDPLEFHRHPERSPGSGRGWIVAALLIALGVGGLLLVQGPLSSLAEPVRMPFGHVPGAARKDMMDQPLHLAAIDQSVDKARVVARTQDEIALAKESNACHRKLRNEASLALLDRCAAFDDAVILIQDRDPLRDRGPFSEITVTGRLWSAASSMSDDSLAIDGRLDRIRLRVELALAPTGVEQPVASAAPKPAQSRRFRQRR
ncbi:MAG: J domain-containing protein [Pseudomonadota bacterium]